MSEFYGLRDIQDIVSSFSFHIVFIMSLAPVFIAHAYFLSLTLSRYPTPMVYISRLVLYV